MISKLHYFICAATSAEVCYGFIKHDTGWIFIGSFFFILWAILSYFFMVYRTKRPID